MSPLLPIKNKHTPHDFSKSFMYSIHQMYFLVQKHLETSLAKTNKLSFSQFVILVGFSCSDLQKVSQSSIAERLHLTEATISRHITALVKLGYISRTIDKNNRRKHIIAITSLGKKQFAIAQTIIDKELEKIFTVIKTTDRAGIIKNFDSVISKLLTKK
jgi:DNA-binding MarR family transcriptional regulator